MDHPFTLKDKSALVIGGSGVIGRAIAGGLLQAGAAVAIAGRNEEHLRDAAAALGQSGGRVHPVTLDAGNPGSLAAGVEDAEKAIGPVSILVAASGGNLPEATVPPEGNFFDMPADAFRAVMDHNLLGGAVLPCQIVGRRMVERGAPASIILIGSVSGERPLSRVAGYSAAKAAVANFTRWLACHFSLDLRSQVRVNTLMPGFFLTEQNRYLLLENGEFTTRARTILDHTPLGRFGQPEDLAGAAVFLAGDASAFVTGSVLAVDGGFTAYSGV